MKLHEIKQTPQLEWKSYIDRAGNIDIEENATTSLRGCPQYVEGHFNVDRNDLYTLQNGPIRVGGFYSAQDCQLTTLQGVASEIGTGLYVANNRLRDLKNIHKQIKYIGLRADFVHNPIQSHVLGLCLITSLSEVVFGDNLANVENILNEIFTKTKDNSERLLMAQEQLIDAGLEPYARL